MSEEKSTNKQKKLKIAKLLEDLASGVPSKVTTALDALQVYGDESIIEPLIQSLDKQKDEKSMAEIVEFLSSLKSTKAVESLSQTTDAIARWRSPRLGHHQSAWQPGLLSG